MSGFTAADELELITRAQEGDRHAFSELVLHHRRGVINVVYCMCGDPALAEDAAQEAFVKAWRRLPSYRPGAPLRNWLYRIATNCAIDSIRRHARTVPLDDLPLPAPEEGPESAAERNELEERVRRAVLALPEGCRAALVLRQYEDLSYAEIAEVLGIPIGTVMSRLHYARGLLRQSLANLMEAH